VLAALALPGIGVAASPGFSSDPHSYVWDLESQFPTTADWDRERAAVTARLEDCIRLGDRAGEDPAALADLLDAVADARGRAARMARYGILTAALDVRSEAAQGRAAAAEAFETEVDSATAFAGDRLRSLGEARLTEWMRREPRLARHRRLIHQALHEAGHALDRDAERVLRSLARVPQLTSDAYWALAESEIGWPVLDASSTDPLMVDPSGFRSLRRSPDAEIRARAAQAFLARAGDLERIYSLLLNRRVEASLAVARLRGFDSAVDAEFYLRDGLPPGSFRLMSQVARDRLPTLGRYSRLRNRALGIATASFWDRQAPLPGIDRSFPIDQAVEDALAVAAKLGGEHQARLRHLLARPLWHFAPSPTKRDLWGVFWQAGGGDPYTIMSYRDDYASARRVSAAAFCMMAYASIPPEAAPVHRLDPAIYSNAVIYAAEALHNELLRSRATTSRERLSYLLLQLDRLRLHAFDVPLFAELDAAVEARVAAGAPMTGEEISSAYLGLLREYHRGVEGLEIEAQAGRAWMVDQPVTFYSFEHLFWPPAMGAGVSIARRIAAGDAAGARAITGVLNQADNDHSHPLLKAVGIDVASRAPYEATITEMEALMDELETLLAPQAPSPRPGEPSRPPSLRHRRGR
jgi:oligoendopeptidase F